MTTSALPISQESLRDRQKAATAELILQTAERCLKSVSLSDLSFALIAKEANIAERTIYRHFPTKEALVDAFWVSYQRRIRQGPYPDTAAALLEAPLKVFPAFDAVAELTRGLVTSPQGRAIAMRTNKERVVAFRRAIRDAVGDLPEPAFTRLCAAVQALYSAATWLQMRDFWALGGKESGRAVTEAIEALLADGKRRARRSKSENQL